MRHLLGEKYLRSEHLSGFDHYKYSSIDTNPISVYIMHPFWNRIVAVCPLWIAPNLLTFTGFLFTVAAFLLLTYYDYSFYASSDVNYPPIPNWVFAVVGICIFLAYILDGIDGKQARRTHTSGPVGELFDHGLDSWTTIFIPTLLYSIFGRSPPSIPPYRMFYICWHVFINFYLSHWEKYNTGVLFLPWSYDISMLMTTLLFLLTSFTGHGFWKITIFNVLTLGKVMEVIFYLTTLLFNIPVTLYNVYVSYRDNTGKMKPFFEAIRPLVPLLIFFALALYWAHKSPTNVIERDPRMFFMLSGSVFSNICCRLIVAQMSSTRCEVFNPLLVPLSFGILLSLMIPVLELFILYALLIIATLAHIYYGANVVNQMCDHFKIKCFKIPYK
ncbi:unnamed protein product [Bemisia tabaci]|uniref:Ethanolaminephosphotransferase 1 n=2 Tax=Bemisia tabaci TaxID=7038 RepID=A0A9P0A1V4_BEMTA|nr:unnamed protein product [Bemisia tabaci]